jgi:transposase-like protein
MASQYTSPDAPHCPNCTRPMNLVRTWPRLGGLPELNSFECKRCSIAFTEVVTGEAAAPERVSALHNEDYHALQ